MAQPPAVVVRTTKPVGELQLHRLGKPVRFRCVRCLQYKTHDLIATTNGNWEQAVCQGCYGIAVHEHREKAKKATESDKLKRLPPGIAGLLAFFRAAGVDAELVSGMCLRINGSQTHSLAHLPPPETLEWKTVVDEIALKYVGRMFSGAVEHNARFGKGPRALLRPHERGFAIMRGDVRLAIIHATRAQIPHREAIYANFLMPGIHWQLVADALHDAEAELAAEWKHQQEAKAAAQAIATTAEAERRRAAARRQIDQLPDGLAPELIDACLEASRRIRLERQVAYERPVVLKCDIGELTLLPIAGTVTRLFMPFRLGKGAETLKGELVLCDRDPLPLLTGEDVADEDAVTAWTWALLGFADVTCIEVEPSEPTARPESTRLGWHPPSSVPRRRSSAPSLPRRRPWPSHLEPVGNWIRYSGSFVAGHRRRLDEGRTASAEACDRARQVGIILRPHETWVRPHTRGVPEGIEICFLWHAPTELFKRREENPALAQGRGLTTPVRHSGHDG